MELNEHAGGCQCEKGSSVWGEVEIAEAKEVAALAEVEGVVELAGVREVMGLGEVV